MLSSILSRISRTLSSILSIKQAKDEETPLNKHKLRDSHFNTRTLRRDRSKWRQHNRPPDSMQQDILKCVEITSLSCPVLLICEHKLLIGALLDVCSYRWNNHFMKLSGVLWCVGGGGGWSLHFCHYDVIGIFCFKRQKNATKQSKINAYLKDK